MKSIAILGSTGSIGVSTLQLARQFPGEFKVRGLVAGRNLKRLASQVRQFSPDWVSIQEKEDIPVLQELLGNRRMEILSGEDGATAIATAGGVDTVVAAIVGGAGLVPTLGAVRAGKEVALANKEALVMAGEIFVREAKKKRARLLPLTASIAPSFNVCRETALRRWSALFLPPPGGLFCGLLLRA